MINRPLSTRMRPMSIKEIIGQEHLLGENQVLDRMVKSKQIQSIILYGPPGTGKTSIARALSSELSIPFRQVNAGVHGKGEIERQLIGAQPLMPIVLLIDEIHRLTKPNQDLLLMYIEEGSVILVGATTENPYMSIVPALRSRTSIFELKPVSVKDIEKILTSSLSDDKGLGEYDVVIDDEALNKIAIRANGDVRIALNTLELAVKSTFMSDDGKVYINTDIVNSCLQSRQIGGDKDGDTHYNLLSAFQKSIRGSDVDASLHYLARLIEAGDLQSILRRLLVITYEDIGLAGAGIHNETLTAIEVCEKVGLPEARIPLSYIVIRLALSPKSNVAYKAIKSAINELDTGKDLSIPKSLHDNHYKGAKDLGKGLGYKYPHDYENNIVKQEYMPKDFSQDRYLKFKSKNDSENLQRIYKNINNILKDNTSS